MTTAQPGQEQRMVTDAMIKAARRVADGVDDIAFARIYLAMHAARPTADLGDDGELIAALWSYAHDLKLAVPLRQAVEEARDRLILYREALENIRDESNQVVGRRGGLNPKLSRICELADALLSRSGDD